jgi:glycosyltransferase involved in cell wall biosynthesis
LTQTWKHPLISVVLPAFNECEALPLVIDAVLTALEQESVRSEIIVIDDGSMDGTRLAMQGVCAQYPNVRYLRFSRNFGKEAALSAGLDVSRGDAVILMDSDGQHPPALLKAMLERWQEGSEIVCAVQATRREPLIKRTLRRWYYGIMAAGAVAAIPPGGGDFRLLDRKAVNAIKALPERNRFMKGLYAWVGFRTDYVPFEAAPRVAGKTKFSMLRLFGLGFTGLTAFTVVPLRAISVAGVGISLLSILYGIYLLFEHYVMGGQPPGWATVTVGIMFLSGLQLLALGIIAEYLGRTFEEVKQRPLYIVAEDSSEVPAAVPVLAAAGGAGERTPHSGQTTG